MSYVEELEQAIERRRSELSRMEQALAILKGESNSGARTQGRDYSGLRITEATRRFITEMGAPQDTALIAETLIARGLETKSKNFVATVYATLDNSSKFKRENGLWALKERNEAGSDEREN